MLIILFAKLRILFSVYGCKDTAFFETTKRKPIFFSCFYLRSVRSEGVIAINHKLRQGRAFIKYQMIGDSLQTEQIYNIYIFQFES